MSLLVVMLFVLTERWGQAFANEVTLQPGDPDRGRQIILDRDKGDCVICHAMPLPGRESHGTIGTPLDSVGDTARTSYGCD
jgi:L-cysteine S-thiosulfotransferase